MKDHYGNEMKHYKGRIWTGTEKHGNIYFVNDGKIMVLAYCELTDERIKDEVESCGCMYMFDDK